MRSRVLFFAAFLAASCATKPQPTTTPTVPATTSPASASAGGNQLTPLSGTVPLPQKPTIRVGLDSDQANVSFPRREGGYVIVTDGGAFSTRRGFTASGPLGASSVQYGVQVAAISDLSSAEGLARRIEQETDQGSILVFDAKEGLHRIVVGTFPDQTSAGPLREDLTRRGFGSSMLVVARPAAQPFTKSVRIVDDEGGEHRFNGESLLVLPASGDTILIAGQPYRGGARLWVNSRGSLNVINELNLEDYTRGVVPNEMGPRVFDEIEALKAQALAARTYAVKRMGDFANEGYDICPTAACQVYKGKATEEPLSDQAVSETAGLIMTHGGSPIDALFTSTCGGETSDVGVMFPGRNEPYLRRVRCVERDLRHFEGRSDGAPMTEMGSEARLFEAVADVRPEGSWTGGAVRNSVQAAARMAGVTLPVVAAPASSRRRDVLRYLAAVWNLQEAAAKLTLPEDREYFFPGASDSPESRAAAFLIKWRIAPAQYIEHLDLDAAMPRDELHALMMSWLRRREMIREVNGKVLAMNGRELSLKAEGKVTRLTIPPSTPVFRKVIDRVVEYRRAPLMIGDRATVIRRANETPVAVVIQANYDGAAFDRTSSFSSWTRTYRADELVKTISRRNPITTLTDLRISGYDASQRVTELVVTAEGGRTFSLKGLPIRWSLNIPDNLFIMEKSTDPDGMARYTFLGKGWGHGVGMCQVGAYGMAFRGSKAEEIVKHYYTDIEVVKANLP
jgi:stage II sporulation protein D